MITNIFEKMVAHYSWLAKQPGWYAYCRQQVREMDEEDSRLFAGIRAEVAKSMVGFVVPPGERGEWWKGQQ